MTPSGVVAPCPYCRSAASQQGIAAGCFIATAAYGSEWHESVTTLRAFRDAYLIRSALGRALVHLYYRTSPSLADAIRARPWARRATRVALSPIVVVAGALMGNIGDIVLTGLMLVGCVLLGWRLRRAWRSRRVARHITA